MSKRIFFFFYFIFLISITHINSVNATPTYYSYNTPEWDDFVINVSHSTGTLFGALARLYDNNPAGDYVQIHTITTTLPTVEINLTLNQTVYLCINRFGITHRESSNLFSGAPENATLYFCQGNDCTYYGFVDNPSAWGGTCEAGVGSYLIFNSVLDLECFWADRINLVYGIRDTSSVGCGSENQIKLDVIALNLTYFTNAYNTLPDLEIVNLQSLYCYNETTPYYYFELNATDPDGDTIYYYDYWNFDFYPEITVDNFEDPDYNILMEGWAFNDTGCNYSTDNKDLRLDESCDNIAMIKWLADEILNSSMNLYFNAWVYLNTSSSYEIWNWYNEKVLGIKLAKYYDYDYADFYTNFSYWNGTEYIDFDTSYYTGLFVIDLDVNNNSVSFCIGGLDEPAYDRCTYNQTVQLQGTTNNILGKFYIEPSFNFQWRNYSRPFIMVDEIKYQFKDTVSWKVYSPGQTILHYFDEPGQEHLTVLVTDFVHLNIDYATFGFPITVVGGCQYQSSYNESKTRLKFLDDTREYIKAIENGEDKFNKGFFFLMFVVCLGLIMYSRSLSVSMITTGVIFLFVSWLLSNDLTQMITSASLIGVGITLLITNAN